MSKIINPAGPQTVDEQQQLAQLAKLIRTAEDVICDDCGASNFINIYKIRKISGLMSGSGRDMVIPVPVYACANCGHVNEKFLKSVGLDRDEPTQPKAASPTGVDPESSIIFDK